MATYNLEGALTLVTGAAGGIGRTVSEAFASAGATVVAADKDLKGAQSIISNLTGTVAHSAVKVDVSDEDSVAKLAETILSQYGRPPSIVIHTAAIIYCGQRKSIFDIKYQELQHILDVNLKGTFFIDHTFGRLMRDHKIEGSIVNFSSLVSKMPVPIMADYCASKAGVTSLTENFSKELAAYNIRVNAVAPGAVATPMLAAIARDRGGMNVAKPNDGPLKRPATPEEVTRLCLFLASKESSFITGQTIFIRGNQSTE